MNIEIINPLKHEGWDDLVVTAPNYSFFLSKSWAQVLSDSYNCKPHYFTVISDGKLIMCVPFMEINSLLKGRRAISLPFTDYCEPVLDPSRPIQNLLDEVADYGGQSKWKYFEVRGGAGEFENIKANSTFYRHVLKLETVADERFKPLRSNIKRNIKKARKEGVEVTIGNTEEAMKEYFRLHCITRQRHGRPPQPYKFFEKIYKNVIAKDKGIIALGKYDNMNIAGAVYLHIGERAIYKFGASDDTYLHLGANPLVMWEAVQWYAQKGFESLCFGRTDLDNTGLRHYKIGWGTEEDTLSYYRYNLSQKAFLGEDEHYNSMMNIGTYVFRRMPLSFSRTFGALFYKQIG